MSKIESTKVLFIEDSDEDYVIVEKAFKKSGINNSMLRLKTGDEALEYLHNQGKYSDELSFPKPGLILLDLNLPGLDGREVLKRLKSDPKLKKIPVIILTTSADQQDIDACYKAGANSYMQKPVEFSGFVEAISRLKDYWFEISILPKKI